MPDRSPVLIAGPTASGKSELALRIAERDGGWIVNADASQVFACWRVLTARPQPADLARARHEFYGHVACTERYSVGRWLREIAPMLEEARRRGARPIVVGGTGLYFTALTQGLTEMPEVPADVRAEADALLREHGIARLRSDLARRDPATLASLDPANPRRLQRAWEVLNATGRGLAAWHRARSLPLLPRDDATCIVLSPKKDLLINCIRKRFQSMLEDRAIDECRAFAAARIDRRLPAAKVLGARELIAHLEGSLSLEAAVEATVAATRRFAKRQRTWFRGHMQDWDWLDPNAGDPLAAVPRPRGA